MLPVFQMMAQQLQRNNPTFQRAMEMARGKNEDELKQVAQNLCRNMGIDMNEAFEQFKNQMGNFPLNGMNR